MRLAIVGVAVAVVMVATVAATGAVAGSRPKALTTFAGTGAYGYRGDGGPATSAELFSPTGLAADARGDVYIADSGNRRVREVSPAGRISTFARIPSVPIGVTVDGHGNVYVSDHLKQSVLKVTPAGKVTTIAGSGKQGFYGDGGPAASAQLYNPDALAVDARGDVYIADVSNRRVREVTPAGIITTVAGNGKAGSSGDGGPASAAELSEPIGLALDGQGDLVIADAGSNRVREVTPAGIISTVAGTGKRGFSGDGGPARSARFNYPAGVALDSEGDLYISDNGNNRLREVNAAGTITTVAGNGKTGYSGEFLPATSARLTHPAALAVDEKGNAYIVDAGNAVRELGPSETSGPLLWSALGGRVICGIAGFLPKKVLCDSRHVPPPKGSHPFEGDPGFVFLGVVGHPLVARLSQYSWAGLEAFRPVPLSGGSRWTIRATGIGCTIGRRAVQCTNRSHHGFTITRTSYRGF
jgi:sugar lactone lactonase YvrE